MTFEDAVKEVHIVWRQVSDQPFPVCKINKRFKVKIARASWKRHNAENDMIEFSELFFRLSDSEAKDVIRHEIAHLVSKGLHRDAEFKAVCAALGASSAATMKVGVSAEYKYEVVCAGCKKILARYHRKGKGLKAWIAYIESGRLDHIHSCGSASYEFIEN